jgi:hypothetical protein
MEVRDFEREPRTRAWIIIVRSCSPGTSLQLRLDGWDFARLEGMSTIAYMYCLCDADPLQNESNLLW